MKGICRFNELKRLLPNISQGMLVNQLQERGVDGLGHQNEIFDYLRIQTLKIFLMVRGKTVSNLSNFFSAALIVLRLICHFGSEAENECVT